MGIVLLVLTVVYLIGLVGMIRFALKLGEINGAFILGGLITMLYGVVLMFFGFVIPVEDKVEGVKVLRIVEERTGTAVFFRDEAPATTTDLRVICALESGDVCRVVRYGYFGEKVGERLEVRSGNAVYQLR